MTILSYDFDEYSKYILYGQDSNKKIILHFVYKVFHNQPLTQLIIYENGKPFISNIPLSIQFNVLDPHASINKYHKMVMLYNSQL